MISQSYLKKLLPSLAQYGKRIADQGVVIQTISEQATADVSSVLGPALVVGQAVAKAHQTFFAWVMGDSAFPGFPLDFQATVAKHASVWHDLRAGLGAIAFTRRYPNLSITQRNNAVTLEDVFTASASAGVSLSDFWGVSLDGQASLERLIRVDLALSRTLAIDPITEESLVLSGVSPRVPDASSMLKKIDNQRTVRFSDALINDSTTAVVQQGDTLQSIAKQFLGDSEQWRTIAEVNNLRTPYISANIVDQLGAVVGQKTLSAAVAFGSAFATLTDTAGLYRDQQIRFVSGLHEQLVTVHIVNGLTVEFTETFTFAFPSDTVLTVYNPTYDAGGRVLQPGDLLLIPISSTRGTLVERQSTANPLRLYGTDIALSFGQLTVTEGDLSTVAGVSNVTQAIRHRFQVERGQLTFHPLYGTGLKTYLAWKTKPFFAFLAQMEAQQTVLRDPRVSSVESFHAELQADTMTIDMSVRTTEQEQFPLPRFTLDVRTS